MEHAPLGERRAPWRSVLFARARSVRSRLTFGYVLLGAVVTILGLGGARTVYRASAERAFRRDVVREQIEDLRATVNGASEESFSYVLIGDPAEGERARAGLGASCEAGRHLYDNVGTISVERARFDLVGMDACRFRDRGEAMFSTFEREGRVSRSTYDAFEESNDALVARVSDLDDRIDAEAKLDRETTARWADVLILAIGLVAVGVAAFAGRALADRVANPLGSLRDALRRFGRGDLEVTVDIESEDEIGQLATAFQDMARDMRVHVHALDAAHAHLHAIFGSMEELLVVCDAEGRIRSANPACLALSRFSESELVGQPATMLFDDLPSVPDVRSTGRARSRGESTLRRSGGGGVPVRLSVSRLRGSSNGGCVVVGENLSERQRLEVELRHAQKMDAIGRLAGGVAHDFNNMLSVILGYTSVLLDRITEDDPTYEALTEVQQAGLRSVELTQQLLAFSRKEALEEVIVDLNSVLGSTARLVKRALGASISLIVEPSSEACPVRTESGQMDNLIMNLVLNARDALPEGGTIRISTSVVEVVEGGAVMRSLALGSGRHVLLAVEDDGTGMDAATMSKIFEPFFTTKPEGKGTGLGLATVFGIVQRSGGRIGVESELGRGTTFRAYMPEAVAAPVSGVLSTRATAGAA